jgi:multicomponent Na+:H+ antiporter subunit D
MAHWIPVLIAIPIAGAVLAPVLPHRLVHLWGLLVLAVTTGIAVVLTLATPLSYEMGGWPAPYGIELLFDPLSGFSVVVAFITLLALASSLGASGPLASREGVAVILLGAGGMAGFLVAGDFFTLFVFLEIFSLAAYGMVAMSEERGAGLAAFRYLLMGASASIVILLSVGLIHTLTGSLNLADVGARLPEGGLPLHLAMAGFTAGFLVKAAAFPLHVWLPDAHATAPSPVSAILSGLVVKMGIVGLIRTPTADDLFLWIGGASLLAGALLALVQSDAKRILAYSTVANIGLIVVGLSVEWSGAVIHMVNHAVAKAALFLAAGAFIHQAGSRLLDGVGRQMPLTTVAFALAAISVVGIPPTGGFTGKWLIAVGALEAGHVSLVVILVFSSVVLAFCYGRLLDRLLFAPPRAGIGEAPVSMLVPIVLLALLSVGLGFAGRPLVSLLGGP